MKNISLDTNAYSRYCIGDIQVKKLTLQADTVFLTCMSLGELYLGLKEGNREPTNLNVLKAFIADPIS